MIELKKEEQKLLLFKDDELYLTLNFLADEFVCIINKNEPLIIEENDNIIFFNKIKEFMSNNYIFADKFSIKTDDKLVWLSDQYGNLEDEYETDKISRLVIEKKDNQFILYSLDIYPLFNIIINLFNEFIVYNVLVYFLLLILIVFFNSYFFYVVFKLTLYIQNISSGSV